MTNDLNALKIMEEELEKVVGGRGFWLFDTDNIKSKEDNAATTQSRLHSSSNAYDPKELQNSKIVMRG